jgi:hypothetical protein
MSRRCTIAFDQRYEGQTVGYLVDVLKMLVVWPPGFENPIWIETLRNYSICLVVQSRVSFMLITILSMISQHLHFDLNLGASSSSLCKKI